MGTPGTIRAGSRSRPGCGPDRTRRQHIVELRLLDRLIEHFGKPGLRDVGAFGPDGTEADQRQGRLRQQR